LTQSGAHTKDLPAQTFLRVSQTFGTHEKTIYAAVSQHIWPGQQTTAGRPADKCKSVGQVNGQQSDKFGKKKSGMPSSNPIEFFSPFGSQSVTYILSYLWIQINQQLLSETSLYLS